MKQFHFHLLTHEVYFKAFLTHNLLSIYLHIRITKEVQITIRILECKFHIHRLVITIVLAQFIPSIILSYNSAVFLDFLVVVSIPEEVIGTFH